MTEGGDISIGVQPGAGRVIVDAHSPWLGLLPFKEEHRTFFFGRDAEIQEIQERIRENSLTILFGQSGLGKSSLLGAGVVPQLRAGGFAPLLLRLDYADSAPALLEQTREALMSLIPDASGNPPAGTLWELLHRVPCLIPANGPAPVLLFDQFEEIFTLGRQSPERAVEAAEWLEQMSDLLQNRPPRALEERFAENRRLARDYDFSRSPVRIVFALREDYLSYLEEWKTRLPLLTQNRMALHLLSGPQALEAVLGPGSLGAQPLVSREVAAQLVRTVADVPEQTPLAQIKAVPPLLSLLCEQLNRSRLDSGTEAITAAMVSGQSADILQRFYEESFATFPPEHRETIRALIEDPPMVTESGHRHSLVLEDAKAHLSRAGVPHPGNVFDSLIQRRLITVEDKDRVARLEITHDVLVPLVVRSRKERRARQEREAALRKLREEAAKARRRRVLVGSMGALTLLAVAGGVYGWMKAGEATREAARAKAAAETAQVQTARALESDRKSKMLVDEASRNDFATAMAQSDSQRFLYLARSLSFWPENPIAGRVFVSQFLGDPVIPQVPRFVVDEEADAVFLNPSGTRLLSLFRGAATSPNPSRVILRDAQTGAELKKLEHSDRVNSCQFTPDGRVCVTADSGGIIHLWNADDGSLLRQFDNLGGPRYFQIVISPDGGTLLAYSSIEEIILIVDFVSGKMRGKFAGQNPVFSPDSASVYASARDGVIRIWDPRDGMLKEQLPAGASGKLIRVDPEGAGAPRLRADATFIRPESIAISPDGRYLATCGREGSCTFAIWDLLEKNSLRDGPKSSDGYMECRFSPDGTAVYYYGRDRELGNPAETLVLPLDAGMSWSSSPGTLREISTDGRWGVMQNEKGIWLKALAHRVLSEKLSGSEPAARLGEKMEMKSSAISVEGKVIAASTGKQILVWEPTLETIPRIPLQHFATNATDSGSVIQVDATTDGRLALSFDPGRADVREAETGKWVRTCDHEGAESGWFTRDGKAVITAGLDGKIRRWSVENVTEPPVEWSNGAPVSALLVSPDGRHFATGDTIGKVRLWELEPGKKFVSEWGLSGGVKSLAFSGDGKKLGAVSGQQARIWSADDGRVCLEVPDFDQNKKGQLQIAPDGNYAAWTLGEVVDELGFQEDNPRSFTMFRLENPGEKAVLPDLTGRAMPVFTPDSKQALIFSLESCGWRRLDQPQFPLVGGYTPCADKVRSAVFSPSGKSFAVCSGGERPGSIDIMDSDQGLNLIQMTPAYSSGAFQAIFARNESLLVAGTSGGAALVSAVALPLPLEEVAKENGFAEETRLIAEAVSGAHFSNKGKVGTLTGKEWRETVERLREMGTHQEKAMGMLAAWLTDRSGNRRVFPGGRASVSEFVETAIEQGQYQALVVAYRLMPRHPLIHIALAKWERAGMDGYSSVELCQRRADFYREYGVQRLPQDAGILRRAARMLREQGDAKRALAVARRARELDPKNSEVLREIYLGLKGGDDFAATRTAWNELTAQAGGAAVDFKDFGRELARHGNAAECRQVYQLARERFPDDFTIPGMQGWSEILLKSPAESLAAFEKSLALLPAGTAPAPDTLAGKAAARWLGGDKVKAVEEYEALLEKDAAWSKVPAMTRSRWEPAEIKLVLQVMVESMKAGSGYWASQSRHELLFQKFAALIILGDHASIAGIVEEYADLTDLTMGEIDEIADWCWEHYDPEKALKLLRRVQPRFPDDGILWYAEGTILREAGRFEEAVPVFEIAAGKPVLKHGWRIWAALWPAMTQWDLGHKEDAMRMLSESITSHPALEDRQYVEKLKFTEKERRSFMPLYEATLEKYPELK